MEKADLSGLGKGNVLVLRREGHKYTEFATGAAENLGLAGGTFDPRALVATKRDYMFDENGNPATHALVLETIEGKLTGEGIFAEIAKGPTELGFTGHFTEAKVDQYGMKKVGTTTGPVDRSTLEGEIVTQKLRYETLQRMLEGTNVFVGLGDKPYETAAGMEVVFEPTEEHPEAPEGFDPENNIYGIRTVEDFTPKAYHDWLAWMEGSYLVGVTKHTKRGNAKQLIAAIQMASGLRE